MQFYFLKRPVMIFGCLIGLGMSGICHGQNPSALRLELNKLETLEDACRAYLVFENNTQITYQSLKLDLVLFDGDGIINRRLAVEGGNLPVGKTSVKLFDIRGTECNSVSRVLLNDVLDCSDIQGPRQNCIDDIDTASRANADFFK